MNKGILDVFTKGTEGIHQNDPRQSLVPVPINEDWCLAGIVESVVAGIVVWHKVWDDTKQFVSHLRYWGKPGIPPASSVVVGQYQVFHRIGEAEFVCFVPYPSILLVEDLGEGQGREVYYDDAGVLQVPVDSEVLPMQTHEPLTQFHTGNPSFMAGRVYPGRKHYDAAGTALYYLVFLAGHGYEDFFFDVDIDGNTLRLTVDFSGKVIDMEML